MQMLLFSQFQCTNAQKTKRINSKVTQKNEVEGKDCTIWT